MEDIVLASLAFTLLNFQRQTIQQAFGGRRQHKCIHCMMPVILDPLSVLLLETFKPPCASQLGCDRAGAREHSTLSRWGRKHSLQFVGEQPCHPLRVGQIACLEFFLNARRILDAVVAFLAPFDFFQTLNAGDILHPLGFRLVSVEPFERRSSALVLIGFGSAECLVQIRNRRRSDSTAEYDQPDTECHLPRYLRGRSHRRNRCT